MKKVIVYYTDSRLEEDLDKAVRGQIEKAADGIPIISVSQKPLDFGENICVGIKPRCYLSLYEQLLTGLEATEDDSIVYLCEHDVFYHPCHFKFVPPRKDKIYYNLNRFYWRWGKEFFLTAIGKRALSQAVSHRDVLLAHAKEQVISRQIGAASPCVGPFDNFKTDYPNIDVRHGGNFSMFGAFDMSHRSRRILSIDHWGTPRRFQERVNYYPPNIVADVLLKKLFETGEQKDGFIEIDMFRSDFPRVFNSLGFRRGAEVGVKIGNYSKLLCEGIPGLKLKCIDPYLPVPKVSWDTMEKRFIAAKYQLEPFGADIIKKTSMHAADEDVPDWSLDFVYIDADHSFDAVMQDIIVWSQKVRPGGVVSGHDYDIPDVKIAVDAYVKMHEHELYVTKKGAEYPDSSPSWMFARV